MNNNKYGLIDTVPAGHYTFSIYVGCDGIEGSYTGDWTFDQPTTGGDAMHAIAQYILAADGKPAGAAYDVEWLYLDVVA